MRCEVKTENKYMLPLFALILLVTVFSGCSAVPGQAIQDVKNVKAIQTAISPVETIIQYPGRTRPSDEITVSSKIPGRISSINVDTGNEVIAGRMLFVLETDDIEAQYKQAKASLDAANANLLRTGDSSVSQQMIQADSAVRQAQTQYDDARDLYEKISKMYDEGAVTKRRFEETDTKYRNALIQLDTAKDNLKLLQEKAAPQQVDVALAQVEQARSALDAALVQLQNATVRSPITGVISSRNADPGEMVSSSVPVLGIINTSTITVEIGVTEKVVSGLHKGQIIPLTLNFAGERKYEGVIDSVSPSADSRTQLYTIKIKLDNSSGTIKPGMLAKAGIPTEKRQDALTVPNQAIITESGFQYVYTVKDDILHKTQVTAGYSDDKTTVITSGLNNGDWVVTEGQSFLNDGDRVKIIS